MQRRLAVLVAAALAGCGSRSALETFGAGGSGAGGSGGAAPNCAIWDLTASFHLDAIGIEQATKPRLIAVDPGAKQLSLSVLRSSAGSPIRYWHGPFEPWIAPPGEDQILGGGFLYFLESPDYAVALSAQPSAYALSVGVTVPPGVLFDPQVVPGAAEPGGEVPFIADVPGVYRPLFAMRRVDPFGYVDHLLGYEQRQGERRRLLVRLVSEKWGGGVEHTEAAGCASTPLVADGDSIGPAFYFATASSRPLGDCDDPLAALEPPRRISIVEYTAPVGVVLSLVHTQERNGEIGGIQLLSDATGLFVAFAERTAPDRATLFALRVGLGGETVSGPIALSELAWPPVFSLGRLGDNYVLASREHTAIGQVIVPVRELSANAEVRRSFVVVPKSVDELSIFGAPDGNQLVLALARSEPVDGEPPVSVLRYGCP